MIQVPHRPIHDARLTRKPRLGAALAVSTLLVTAALLWTPEALLRFLFGVGKPAPTRVERAADPFADAYRLIPAPRPARPAPPAEAAPTRERLVRQPTVEPVPDDAPTPERRNDAWTFDPTTPHRVLAEILAPRGPARPDTLARRADLLRRLTLSDLRYLQPTDTTQVDVAWRQWRDVDDYVNRVYGPLWNMQGFAQRLSDLYWRAFYEPEREGH